MDKSNIISLISQTIINLAPNAKNILFGSVARGEQNESSDIDILILLPDEMSEQYNKIRSDIYDELYLLELKFDVIISPLILLNKMWESKTTPFTINVEKDGILI